MVVKHDKKQIESVEGALKRADALEASASQLMSIADQIRTEAQGICPHPEADRARGRDEDGSWEQCEFCGKLLD